MPRLLRPYIPLAVRLRVAMRQLGLSQAHIDDKIRDAQDPTRAPRYRGVGHILNATLAALADKLNGAPADLQLDHQPALENRLKLVLMPNGRKVRQVVLQPGGQVLRYFPDANDPEYLVYRTKHAHHIKTNVRGDGAQHPDRVLAKRERRRNKKVQKKRRKWSSSPLRGRSTFPPKGSRPFRRKP